MSAYLPACLPTCPFACLHACMQVPSGDELMLVFPVSKLLDVLKFSDPASSQQQQQGASTTSKMPYVRRIQSTPVSSQAGSVDVLLEVVAPKPCWGTLKLVGANGRSIGGWSIKGGEWQEAGGFLAKEHSGSGSVLSGSTVHAAGSVQSSNSSVSSLIVKFTSEQQQQPLRWPITVRLLGTPSSSSASFSSQQHEAGGQEVLGDGASSAAGLRVELHVGDLAETPQLAAVEARMPAWSTLSYRATVFVSHWLL